MGNHLARLRRERDWKQSTLILKLRDAATRRGKTLVGDESLKRRIAGWENQHKPVSDFYRELLCEVYGLTAVELGLAAEPAPPPPAPSLVVPELAERITFSRLDGSLVELLHAQTQNIRMLDRRLGGATIYRQAAAHVETLDSLVRYALPGAHREAAADELSQAAALGGWQALDMGLTADAWRLHEIAVAAGRESGETAALAYARAQQAYILLDAGELDPALALIKSGQTHAGRRVSPVLRAWLHAAEGEALAALGRRDAALRALDAATTVLPHNAQDDALPYLMLDAGHLARWRGHCLARLGDGDAIDDLTSALGSMGEGRYGRAEVSLRVDLALAFHARGDVTESRTHARRAADLAGRTGSERQRRRIAELLSA
jgi:tetratricopeptide (TPR) repeat protein